MTLDDLLTAAAKGATIVIQNLTINTGDTYTAENMAIGGGASVNASRNLSIAQPSSRVPLIVGGVDYQYSHCAPLDPALHTHEPEPFEPDVWQRHAHGDVYRG